ncbi:hypothetical protein N7495_003241 [Penicillium taxi]|uniref:uncharacterized protein n=1 Tax=Penicillium taxi TaxID=168475 RepID=UPI0025456BF1|nr:uncharacterized protein N7495_003241 [Penicillium taxi]KAJ5902713.1 hypothetical protein N7495_003241 [Penicillium taxi]
MLQTLRSIFYQRKRAMDPLIVVLGATGTGKSKLAVDIASRFNGEIINGDAMQMYRGLPVITNQIPIEERKGIPHHLLSFIELDSEPWRISKFKNEALRLIDEIRSRGKLPILVGGTHYYTQAVLFRDQLVNEKVGDEDGSELYEEVSVTAEKWPILDAPPEVLMEKLREVDPVMAARWHPKDVRKIRRSLEIYFQTGQRASDIYAEQKALKKVSLLQDRGLLRFSNTLLFWVHTEKEVLDKRLDTRVDAMVQQGLMSEAQKMSDYIQTRAAQGVEVDQTRGVWVSIGFKEMAPYFTALEKGESSQELTKIQLNCFDLIRIANHQYGVSQVKWIKNKLWRALSEADMTHRLYLLDSSDVDEWTKRVGEPSERLVESFLQGESIPHPKTISDLASTILGAKEEQTREKPVSQLETFTCDICRKTMVGEDTWNTHINGYKHKGVLKSRAKKEARDAYFRKRDLEAQEAAASSAENQLS